MKRTSTMMISWQGAQAPSKGADEVDEEVGRGR